MSSSTESMSKCEEKKGNPEKNSKDDMPKEDTTVEINSKGARPKTSSMLVKSKMETEEEGHSLIVLSMNALGPNNGKDSTPRRKLSIQNVINTYNPVLVHFQEFKRKQIHGPIWSPKKFPKGYPVDPVPEHYKLTGNDDASIMYNSKELIVTEISEVKLKRLLEELQRPTSKHETPIPIDFAPFPRMCLRVVKTIRVPVMEFISISWHGRYTGMNNDDKVDEFTHLIIFLNKISKEFRLPILIAGDFNVGEKLICHEVKEPFKLYKCNALEGQKKNGVIDYFIASKELQLSDMTPVDLKQISKAERPEKVLDHEPIKAILKPAPPSDTAPPLHEVTVTNEEIDDLIPFQKLHLSDATSVDLKKDLKADKPEEVLHL